MYVPLRTHSWFSLLSGADAPAELLERAAELGLPALALTDVDSLAGTTEFLRAAERLGGPRPILGAELSDPAGRAGRLVALVRDEQGYRNLCKLVSARQLGDDPGRPGAELDRPERFDLADAAPRFREGLFFLADHPRLLFGLAERLGRDQLFVAISLAALGKRAPIRRSNERARAGERAPVTPEQALEPPKVPPPARSAPALELVRCARALNLATLAVPDVYCARASGFEHHRMRTAIKHNALLCDLPEDWLAERPAHLPASEELGRLYAELPECRGPLRGRRANLPGALARTLLLAEACRYVPPLGRVLFPEVELAAGETPYSRLCQLAFDGARRRFAPLEPKVVRRLDHELGAIEELGFSPYFLLVKRIADYARARNIPSVGRGSAADSLVAYCLELTDADPLRYRLPFERFLNPSRRDRPDIDLDFCWRRRDEVILHLGEVFGTERTAMIATVNRFGLRAAFRESALAAGIPPVEVNRWSRRLPGMGPDGGAGEAFDGSSSGSEADEPGENGDSGVTFGAQPSHAPGWAGGGGWDGEESEPRTPPEGALRSLPPALRANPIAVALAATPECRGFPFEDARMAAVLRSAAALLDSPRHLGLHPGGVVVAPGPITDVVSCQRAAKGVIMTQLDKDGVEAIGLVKMDLLGNRALTVIDDCLQSLGKHSGELAALPEDDPRTAELLVRGRTLGCFQVESPGMRNLLQETGARTLDDVIQAVALIRPGPAGSGMKDAYVRRFRGLEEPRPPHPRLAELLADTHGVMLYQEDVMQAVVALAGFELAAADELRRALAKKRGNELEALRERFLAGCDGEGVEREDAERVWELVQNFSSFGFCKAHAVTYGRIAYRAVWLKAHHPAAYLVAFLNSRTGYYDTRVYVEEARRLGVAILPPDVNRSAEGFTLEHALGSVDGPAIRVGLERVKGLSESTRRSILEARERGAFLSLPDFLARSRARADETECLILCGAFDAFDRTRPEMLWRLHLLTAPARRLPATSPGEAPLDPSLIAACRTTPEERARESARAPSARGGWSKPALRIGAVENGEVTLFPLPSTPALALPQLAEPTLELRGQLELEILGLTVCAHPSELFPCAGEERTRGARLPPLVPCAELVHHREEQVSLRGWLAASRRVRTADGRWMRFLTLEDTSGLAEIVLFPPIYARDGHRLGEHGPYLVSGRVEVPMGACTLHAERIW